jgi:hypothetical protein
MKKTANRKSPLLYFGAIALAKKPGFWQSLSTTAKYYRKKTVSEFGRYRPC